PTRHSPDHRSPALGNFTGRAPPANRHNSSEAVGSGVVGSGGGSGVVGGAGAVDGVGERGEQGVDVGGGGAVAQGEAQGGPGGGLTAAHGEQHLAGAGDAG